MKCFDCSYIKILGRLNTMVNVVGYIRVSTVNQVKEGYSLGEQLDEIEKYCAANGFITSEKQSRKKMQKVVK